MNLDTFNDALLALDAQVRRNCLVRDPSERQRDLLQAHKRLLAEVGPFRMQALVHAHDPALANEETSTETMLGLLARALELADAAGVKRSDIVALVNRETMEHH